MAATNRVYGWKRDHDDHVRDYKFSEHPGILTPRPPIIDEEPAMPAVYDQLDLGSCTGNATGGAIHFDEIKQHWGKKIFVPSRMKIYYDGRVIEGTTDQDCGCEIRDVIKAVATVGVCPEIEWPYDVTKFNVRPPQSCYTHSALHKVVRYYRVPQTAPAIEACLASGFPTIFGFDVFEEFEGDAVAQTGIVPMPGSSDTSVGGHAVLLIGYNQNTRMFKVRNSWGKDWGQRGYFFMPYDYVLSAGLANDFWTLRFTTGD